MTSADDLARYVDEVPDFPKEGVLFRDISPLLRHKGKLKAAFQEMVNLFSAEELENIDAFVGLDSRGFIFAPGMALLSDKGFVMARKGGKLPEPLFRNEYDLEYGTATIEMKEGTGKVIIVDDVLATGGTLKAAADLCEKAGYEVAGFATPINLRCLNNFEWKGLECRAVLNYDENGYIPQEQRPAPQP